MYFLMDEVLEKLEKLDKVNEEDFSMVMNKFKEEISYEELKEINALLDKILS